MIFLLFKYILVKTLKCFVWVRLKPGTLMDGNLLFNYNWKIL